jgi:hypothetical protein
VAKNFKSKTKAKKASPREHRTALRALMTGVVAGTRPEHARPIADFMCFRTDEEDVFIKCFWNPVEQRFNKDCHRATREECRGGA